MATKVVNGKVTAADGSGRGGVVVRATLSQGAVVSGTSEVPPYVVSATSAADGTFSLTLQANNDLTPTGTYYSIDEGGYPYQIVVPQSAGPFAISTIQVNVPPTASPTPSHVSTLLSDGSVTAGTLLHGASLQIDNGPVTLPATSIADAALSANVVLETGAQTITGVKHFSAAPVFDAGFSVSAGVASFAAGITVSAGAVSLPTNAIVDAAVNSLSASKLTGANGLPDAVLSTNVDLLNAAQNVTAVKTFTVAPIFSAGFSVAAGQVAAIGTGDNVVYISANGVAQQLDIRQGTTASPITSGSGPSVKVSRTESILEANMPGGIGAANWGNAGIWSAIIGDANTQAQVNAGFFSAQTASTQSAHNDDALAISAHGAITGSATGYAIAAYLEGRRETATGNVNTIEIRVNNNTATDGTYNATGASDTMGLWFTPGATDFAGRVSGVGIQFGSINSGQFAVGIGFSVIGGVSSIKTTSISDDSTATNSILISGTHTTAIGVKTGSGKILIGHTNASDAATNANALIEAFTTSVGARGLISNQGSGATAELSYKLGNSAGSAEWFVVGTAGHLLTGSLQGDTGIIINSASKRFLIGGTTIAFSVTNGNAIGFFSTTEITQYNTTGTATGFVAGAGTTVTHLSTFTGNTGSTAYTIADVVRAMKLYGLMAA